MPTIKKDEKKPVDFEILESLGSVGNIIKGILSGGTVGTFAKLGLGVLVIGLLIWWKFYKHKLLREAAKRKTEERKIEDDADLTKDTKSAGKKAAESEAKARDFLKKKVKKKKKKTT